MAERRGPKRKPIPTTSTGEKLKHTREYQLIIDDSYTRLPEPLRAYFETRAVRHAKLTAEALSVAPAIREHYMRSQQAIQDTAQEALAVKESEEAQLSEGERKPRKALILGAGGCDDIPLSWLAYNFDEVTLIELGYEATRQAVQRKLPPHLQKKITIIAADMTGLLGSMSETLSQLELSTSSSGSAYMQEAFAALTATNTEDQSPNFGNDYTFISSQLIMSQLEAPPEHRIRDHIINSGQRILHDERMFFEANRWGLQHLFIRQHIDDLARRVNSTGRIHLSETYEYSSGAASQGHLSTRIIDADFVNDCIAEHFIRTQEDQQWQNGGGEGKLTATVVSSRLQPKPKMIMV